MARDDNEKQGQAQAPEPQLRARNHSESCSCRMCEAIRQKHQRSLELPPQKRRVGMAQMKRQKFVAALTDPENKAHGNPRLAAKQAGYSPSSAGYVLDHPQTQRLLIAALTRQGITEEQIAAKYVELLAAKETKVLSHFDEDTKKFVTEKVEVPDPHAQVKALALLHQVRGDILKEEKQEGALVIIRASVLTPGHQRHCTCPSCTEALEKLAEKCREQVSKIPEPEPPEE